LIQRYSFQTSKFLSVPQFVEFHDLGMEMSSLNGNSTLWWRDVYTVQELKPCFVIYRSPEKYFLIPRRCFHNQGEVELLRRLIIEKVDKKKRKLKKYHLGKVEPDDGQISNPGLVEGLAEDSEAVPLIELNFSLMKNEFLAYNFEHYYTYPTGIILTLAGIAIATPNLINFIKNTNYNSSLLIFGLMLIFLTPVVLYINVSRQFNDVSLKMRYSFKIYEDYLILNHPAGVNRVRWANLVKGIEHRSAILLYITPYLAYIIPKRIFAGNEAGLEKLRQLMKTQKKLKRF
jgi:hypothetical protein